MSFKYTIGQCLKIVMKLHCPSACYTPPEGIRVCLLTASDEYRYQENHQVYVWIHRASNIHLFPSSRIFLKISLNHIYIFLFNSMYWAYCQEIQNPVFCVQVELKSILKVFVITFLIKETSLPGTHSHSQIHSTPPNLWRLGPIE